jgi:hypothetical protein
LVSSAHDQATRWLLASHRIVWNFYRLESSTL